MKKEFFVAKLKCRYTLLKIKVLQKDLQAMPQKNRFQFHKEPFSQRFFKETSLYYLFII